MKKICIILFLSVIMLSSCYLLTPYPMEIEDEVESTVVYYKVTCTDLFVVGATAYTKTYITLPKTIYNPNVYAITVTCDGKDFAIASHESITIISGASH